MAGCHKITGISQLTGACREKMFLNDGIGMLIKLTNAVGRLQFRLDGIANSAQLGWNT